MIYAARQFCFGFFDMEFHLKFHMEFHLEFDMEFHLEFDMEFHLGSNMKNVVRFHAAESAERKGIGVNERQCCCRLCHQL